MATALRPIAHEDRLSLVEHLDELRTRIILCLVVFVGGVRVLLLAERPDPGDHGPAAREVGVHEGQQRSAGEVGDVPAGAEALLPAVRRAQPRDGALGGPQPGAAGAVGRAEPLADRDGGRRARGEPRGARSRSASASRSRSPSRSSATRRCCWRCRSCSTRRTRSCCRRSRRASGGRAAADGDGAVPVHRRRACSRTTWSCRTRSTSCRTSTTTTSTSCCRRGTTTASRSWS